MPTIGESRTFRDKNKNWLNILTFNIILFRSLYSSVNISKFHKHSKTQQYPARFDWRWTQSFSLSLVLSFELWTLWANSNIERYKNYLIHDPLWIDKLHQYWTDKIDKIEKSGKIYVLIGNKNRSKKATKTNNFFFSSEHSFDKNYQSK